MGTNFYDDKEKIEEILEVAGRLKSLLVKSYEVDLDSIEQIMVDSDNTKIDLIVGGEMLRFKAKGDANVLVPDPEVDGVKMEYDPALNMGIRAVCEEF